MFELDIPDFLDDNVALVDDDVDGDYVDLIRFGQIVYKREPVHGRPCCDGCDLDGMDDCWRVNCSGSIWVKEELTYDELQALLDYDIVPATCKSCKHFGARCPSGLPYCNVETCAYKWEPADTDTSEDE